MSGQQLYDELKNALKFFGVHFHDMDQVVVTFREGAVVFSYDGRSIEVKA